MNPALPPIDRDYALGLLSDLVRINSVNPMASQGGAAGADPERPGERRLALRLADELRGLGASVEVTPAREAGSQAEERPNVTGTWRGRGERGERDGRPGIVLCSHLDTVDAAGMADPFDPVLRDGRLFGRGALDAKGQLVAFLAALHASRRLAEPLPADVTLA
ncbi:MAG: M20/M25/M40 family metallo-hydrolase, partial [Nitrospinota bacterium]